MLLPRHPSSLVQVIPLLISFEILCFLYSFTTLVCVPKLNSLLFPGFEPYMRVCVEPYTHTCVLSHIQFFVTPWTVNRQALLSMGFP